MPITKSRQIAKLFKPNGIIKESLYDSDAIVTSAQLGVTAAAGTTTYSSADTLPASANNGDQALVTSTNRLYIYSNGGWYNIALINSTPYWSTEASSSYDLNTDSTSTTITLLAVDSEGVPITYTAVTDSDFDTIATITKDSDNGRTFTITPTDSENGTAVAGTGTVTFRASDGVNLISTLSTFSISFSILNSNYTTLLLKADTTGTDNQVDASTNSYTITENGNVTSTAFTPHHPGGYSFNFNDGYYEIVVPDSTDFDFGTGDFTMEGWYYCTDSTLDNYLLSFSTSSGNGHFGVNFYQGSWRVGLFNGSLITSTTGVESNVWHHFAWVRESGTMKFYIDGTQVGSDLSYSSALDCSGTFKIGAYANSVYGGFWGYLTDIRIVKGTAVYTGNFTAPTSRLTAISNTVLLACHLPYLKDGSSSNHTLSLNPNALINGDQSIKRFSPYDYNGYAKSDHGGSVYFPGTYSDYLNFTGFTFTGDYTAECWAYSTSVGANYNVIFYGGGNTQLSINATGVVGQMGTVLQGAIRLDPTQTGANLNEWVHYVWEREGSVHRIYANGKLIATNTTTVATFTIDTIGRYGSGSGYEFAGYLSDVRLTNAAVYGGSDFNIPTAPLTAITNTQLLTCTNENNIWEQGSGSLLTKAGNTTASDTQRQFTSSSAIYFDGSGDEITTPASDSFNYGTGDFTWEAWVYVSSQGTYDYVFCQHTVADGLGLYMQGGVWKVFHAAVIITTSTSVSNNTWYHVALARDSGTLRLFVDGTLAGSATLNDSIPSGSTYGITLGRWTEVADAQYFHGYMQDVRVTKGLARYTSNFTPPTAEFDG